MTTSDAAEPLVFTDAHYIALGKLVVQFQELEQAITFGLARLMQPKDLELAFGFTHTVLNELPFANRLKLLSNFVETHPVSHFVPSGSKHEKYAIEDYQEELANLKNGIKLSTVAEGKRNSLIHSNWLTSPAAGPPGTVLRVKKRAKSNKTIGAMEFISASDIQAIVEEMERATSLIMKSASRLHILLYVQT